MSIKCSVFIATSLDGFIARKDGSIDWLIKANTHASAGEDGGYKSYILTVDRLVMGRYSFEKVSSFDEWPYGDLPVIVMSSQSVSIPKHLQHCVSISSETPTELVRRLSKQGAKHLYVDGGVTIQGFLADNLIGEMTITIAPVLLGSGRPLFGLLKSDIDLHLIEERAIGGGFVQDI
jgi:dihydrofolate reductase